MSLTNEEKEQKIKEVREKLHPNQQKVFDEYCNQKKNPQLKRNLENKSTKWDIVLRRYESRVQSAKERELTDEVEESLKIIRECLIGRGSKSYESAVSKCKGLLKLLEEKRIKELNSDIEMYKNKVKRLEEERKQLEETRKPEKESEQK